MINGIFGVKSFKNLRVRVVLLAIIYYFVTHITFISIHYLLKIFWVLTKDDRKFVLELRESLIMRNKPS